MRDRVTIQGATRREDTILRLGGSGDNWHMTWAADDSQFVAGCEGFGWDDEPSANYNSALYTAVGDPPAVQFERVLSYPDLSVDPDVHNPEHPDPALRSMYYAFGTLAARGQVFQFLSTPNRGIMTDHPETARWIGAKLIYSPDNGRTWHNQDGSSPVVWESWGGRSRENMAFYEESQDAFSLLSILQMGKDYGENSDGYVYVYAPNGNTDGTANELVMFRAPLDGLLDRSTYEYFAGLRSGGDASWTKDIDERGVVHTFPLGYVENDIRHPHSWLPSVTYNAPLGLYMMANFGWGLKQNYLGLYYAENPWGPWVQFHEETAWMPANDANAVPYEPTIAPKWIAPDGRSFWMVWTDWGIPAEARQFEQEATQSFEQFKAGKITMGEAMKAGARVRPYYSFNAQRVDLDVR